MRHPIALAGALAGMLFAATSAALASDYGGVVLGRRTGPDGALLVAPIAEPGRSRGYVVVAPSSPGRGDVRYGRTLPGYLGGYYGTMPGAVYEIPNQDRLYCPDSRAYYPAVQDCATPWLRMRPGGGVTADSPIPSPAGQHYNR